MIYLTTPQGFIGIENRVNLLRGKFNFNINQTYDFNKVNNYRRRG